MDQDFDPTTLSTYTNGRAKFDARRSYRDGYAMLSVYGYVRVPPPYDSKAFFNRILLNRTHLPAHASKREQYEALRGLCEITAVQLGVTYQLRSKLPWAKRDD